MTSLTHVHIRTHTGVSACLMTLFCNKNPYNIGIELFYRLTKQTNGVANDDRAGIVEVGDDLSGGDDRKGVHRLC